MESEVARLREELAKRSKEIEDLKRQLGEKEAISKGHESMPEIYEEGADWPSAASISPMGQLDNESIARYSRQLILPELGVKGQLSLRNSSVLIVGAGGLGCPSSIYLAAAGIGRLGIVDYDEVETSNLHRQILHTENRVGVSKAQSVAYACQQINSSMVCIPYHLSLTSENALDVVKGYDIVLDATDNVASRYLLNDLCVLTGKPLVSGSALRFEGQLTVYNYKNGPCYRCLYPKPPPPETVTNCSDGGVVGAVPGVIGVLQALEAIKITAGIGTPLAQRLLLFDGLDGSFRTIKLRASKPTCSVCGNSPSITGLIDYEQFCGARASDKDKEVGLLKEGDRISSRDYHGILERGERHLLVDVRMPVEMEICQLPNSYNIPITRVSHVTEVQKLKERIDQLKDGENKFPVFVVCRKGNDSQLAVQKFRTALADQEVIVKDIQGGLTSWARHVQPSFPTY